jgi:coenzyme F420 hydrogenase subunit delta
MATLSNLDILPEHCVKSVVVLGCGNVLLGDDGFGPAVAERLASGEIPVWSTVIDAGTAVRELLFDMALSDQRPERIVVVDAVDAGRKPGEVFEIPLEEIPEAKVTDFSPHQAPTSNLLRELRDHCDVEVTVLVCQVSCIPREVQVGLSPAVKRAVERMARLVRSRFLCEEKTPRSAGVG